MQPLDVSDGPLKRNFELELNTFQKHHAGRIINLHDICKIFAPTYLRPATPQNAISGFAKSGVTNPYSPAVFDESNFVPLTVTSRLLEEESDTWP